MFSRALTPADVASVYQKGLSSVVKYASGATAQSLTVDATRLMGGAEGLVYEFTVSARSGTLLSGRVTVSLFRTGRDE